MSFIRSQPLVADKEKCFRNVPNADSVSRSDESVSIPVVQISRRCSFRLNLHRMISGLSVVVGGTITAMVGQRLIAWIANCPCTPDPWGTEVENEINRPDATEVCHHCSAPQSPTAWFCPHCGNAVGPYNNLMPYVRIFSEGEVLRNGVNNKLRRNSLIVFGYFLVSLGCYFLIAPVYWFFLVRNLKNPREEKPEGNPLTPSV
jgi:hypothetical protein